MEYLDIHKDFRLNSTAFNAKELEFWAKKTLEKPGEQFVKQVANFIVQWLDSKDYIELTTSGTTGSPKLIQLKKSAVVSSAKATGAYFNLPSKTTALLCMSPSYVAGKLMIVRALVLGWDLDLVEPSSSVLTHNDKYYDFVAMVPMQVQGSLAQLHRVKCLIVGGASVDEALKQKLKGISTRVYETYGMTETITHIAAKTLDQEYFEVLNHVRIEKDSRDCLVIYAPSISKEPIVTNDIVDLQGENSFKWLGRVDNVINSGGVKLHPEEIEKKLSPYISNRFFIASKTDSYLGNKVILVIESEPYKVDPLAFEQLSKYEIPKEIQFCPVFKQTGSGKVIRKENIK